MQSGEKGEGHRHTVLPAASFSTRMTPRRAASALLIDAQTAVRHPDSLVHPSRHTHGKLAFSTETAAVLARSHEAAHTPATRV